MLPIDNYQSGSVRIQTKPYAIVIEPHSIHNKLFQLENFATNFTDSQNFTLVAAVAILEMSA